jgi:hypothetical protein
VGKENGKWELWFIFYTSIRRTWSS